jgi:hypothetical protein
MAPSEVWVAFADIPLASRFADSERVAEGPIQEERKMKKLASITTLFVLVLVLAPQVSSGQTAAFNFTPIPAGDVQQGWTGNLASLFDVAAGSSITISDLGIFNQSGTGYITGKVEVVLYNVTTGLQVSQIVTFGPTTQYTAQGYAVYQAIAPVTLGPGDYAVDAVGFGPADTNGNNGFPPEPAPTDNTFGGTLSFPTNPSSFYDYNTSLDLPTIPDPHIYEAGNFEVVPEGGASWLYLLLAGAVCFGAMAFGSRNRLGSHASA